MIWFKKLENHGYDNKHRVKVVEQLWIKETTLTKGFTQKRTVVSCVKVLCFVEPITHLNADFVTIYNTTKKD